VGGEKVKKVAVAVLVFTLLLMVTVIAPAFAAPAQKLAFAAKQIPNMVQPPSPDVKNFLTEGDTAHARNMNGAGTINSSLAVTWMTPNHQGTTSSVVRANINLKTGEGDIVYEMTWTFLTGSFQGNIVGKISAAPYTQSAFFYAQDLHGVLRGDGEFEGWTIMVDGGKAAGMAPFIWQGTIVVPR
jgi:hypothetical protein